MYNIFIGKKLIASFVLLRDARSYVDRVLVAQFSRKGYNLIAIKFPRHGEPQEYTFGCVGSYEVIFIVKV